MTTRTEKLRQLLAAETCHPMPCCWDGLSAKMIADAGFQWTSLRFRWLLLAMMFYIVGLCPIACRTRHQKIHDGNMPTI